MDALGNCSFAELAGRALSEFFQHASKFCLALVPLASVLVTLLRNKNGKANSLEKGAKASVPGQVMMYDVKMAPAYALPLLLCPEQNESIL